jgi:hypothetical protein
VLDGLDVAGDRDLEERRPLRLRRQPGQDADHRRHRRLVAHEEQPVRRTRHELDAAEGHPSPGRHGRDPVSNLRLSGPRGARAGGSVADVEHEVDHQPGVRAGAAHVAHGVGAHVAALLGRPREPGLHPGLVDALERVERRRRGEDQLDPLVVARAVGAEVGQRRGGELDPDEARRDLLEARDLDLCEQERQRGRGGGHRGPRS